MEPMTASNEDMERLRKALQAEGKRVEIDRHRGFASGSAKVAAESARDAAETNARGERVVRIMDAEGREFECGVSAEQAHELLGAERDGPASTRQGLGSLALAGV